MLVAGRNRDKTVTPSQEGEQFLGLHCREDQCLPRRENFCLEACVPQVTGLGSGMDKHCSCKKNLILYTLKLFINTS